MCAARDRFDRILADRDKDGQGENPPADRRDPGDGRRVVIRYKGRAVVPAPTS